jgi:hypothetical protein
LDRNGGGGRSNRSFCTNTAAVPAPGIADSEAVATTARTGTDDAGTGAGTQGTHPGISGTENGGAAGN